MRELRELLRLKAAGLTRQLSWEKHLAQFADSVVPEGCPARGKLG